MKTHHYKLNEKCYFGLINLFDILQNILRGNNCLFYCDEKVVDIMNEKNRKYYLWEFLDEKKEIKNGDLNFKLEDNESYSIVNFDEYNEKTFNLYFSESSKKDYVYRIVLFIEPVFKKIIMIREFSDTFDNYKDNKYVKAVTWKDVDLNKFVKTNKDYSWYKWNKKILVKEESIINKPSFNKHDGVWYYGYRNDDNKFVEVIKLKVIISPRIIEIIDFDNKNYTLGKVFYQNKKLINENVVTDDIDCANDWIAYLNKFKLKTFFNMIEEFEKKIILPLTIEYYDDFYSLFEHFLKVENKTNILSIEIQRGIFFLKDEWFSKIKEIKDEITEKEKHKNLIKFNKKFLEKTKEIVITDKDDYKNYNPIYKIYDLFDEFVFKKEIPEILSNFLKNQFFSLKQYQTMNKCQVEKTKLKSGTYILRHRNKFMLKEYLKRSVKSDKIYFIPDHIDLLKTKEIVSPVNDLFFPILIVYYLNVMNMKKIPSNFPIESFKFLIDRESVLYYSLTPRDMYYSYLDKDDKRIVIHNSDIKEEWGKIMKKKNFFFFFKFPNLITNYNDRFVGYYLI